MSQPFVTVLEQFCSKFGIGKDRKVKSSRGRTGILTGVEFANDPKNQKVWIMVDDTPGILKVSADKFKPKEAHASKA